MFKKLNEEIISKSEEKIDEQNRKIDRLEGKIAIQANKLTSSLSNVMTMNSIADVIA